MSKLINISEATSIAIHSMALIGYEDKQLNANEIAKRHLSFNKHSLHSLLLKTHTSLFKEVPKNPLRVDPL